MMHSKRLKQKAQYWLVMLSALIVFVDTGITAGHADGKVTIGPVEEVILLPWRLKLLARIDTGANTSSIGAEKLKIRGNTAHFTLGEEYSGIKIELPIVEWKTFSSSESHELRPVVEMEICLGPKRLRIQVSLNDRSRVAYPFLVGRRVLEEGAFIVDVSRTIRIPAACAGNKPK
jgi:hypothetical protein